MRKLIASINMTLDGFCNHEAMIADESLHQHVNKLFQEVDLLLFGRITYQLMESSWPAIVQQPTGDKATDEFAVLIDNKPKLVFSHTLKKVDWKNTSLATGNLEEELQELKQQSGGNMLVGGPSIITQLANLNLVDEYQLLLQPIVLGSGLTLFKNISHRIDLHLLRTKTLESGVVVLYYAPKK